LLNCNEICCKSYPMLNMQCTCYGAPESFSSLFIVPVRKNVNFGYVSLSAPVQMEEMVSRGSRSVRPTPQPPSHSHWYASVSCCGAASCGPSRPSPAAGTTQCKRSLYLFASLTVHSPCNTKSCWLVMIWMRRRPPVKVGGWADDIGLVLQQSTAFNLDCLQLIESAKRTVGDAFVRQGP